MSEEVNQGLGAESPEGEPESLDAMFQMQFETDLKLLEHAQKDLDVNLDDLMSFDVKYDVKTFLTIFLKATANAPILKKRNWVVEPDRTVSSISAFVRKYIKLEASESLYLYVNQSFAPSPDQTMKNLYECFGTDGKLILHYCISQAWG